MSGEGTITLELDALEAREMVRLCKARLMHLAAAEKSRAVDAEVAILGSLAVKLFTAVLPMALQEVMEENDRLN